jgi:Ser-tRNA(Ala) deacylase AlaX
MTKLKYLENTYNFETQAKVIDISALEDGRTAVLLDETIFYPQGGGQPCDTGIISTDDSLFKVTDVRMDKEGNVLHIGTHEKGKLSSGELVKLSIDRERRIKNAKAHSAGHLIDCAIIKLGSALNPTKGYHFPEGPNVEYEGQIDNSQETIKKIQELVDELCTQKINIISQELSREEATKQNLFVPTGKGARIISFEGFSGCGCGGTHVRNSGEIGKIIIRKIKTKSGITKISYEVV